MGFRQGGRGMTRNPDHSTSEKAADQVTKRKPTIRARVLRYAENTPDGFTDEDLRRINPDAPESSIRKRRTELSNDFIILKTDRERMNGNGSMVAVWVHRKFHPNPPPEIVRPKGARSKALARRKAESVMWNALVECASGGAHRLTTAAERAVADALGMEYPIRVTEIPAKRPL